MRISPIDIRQQQFTKRFWGLDSAEVDAFLEDVAEDLESVLKENALLREQLSTLEERTRNLAEREKMMEEARAEEARIHTEILAIKRVRRQLAEDLRATVTRYERMLARDTLTE